MQLSCMAITTVITEYVVNTRRSGEWALDKIEISVTHLSVVVLTDMMVETSSLICVKLGCSMRRRSTAIRFRAVLS